MKYNYVVDLCGCGLWNVLGIFDKNVGVEIVGTGCLFHNKNSLPPP